METRFQTVLGVRKPDLVVVTDEHIIVLNLQIRSDSIVSKFDACSREKIVKYSQHCFLNAIRES